MRKIIEPQGQLFVPSIDKITIDVSSRDEIPELLLGIQSIYSNRQVRKQVFEILADIIPAKINQNTGRNGMPLWKILVFGMIRLGCNCDYDKLKELADNHFKLRQMLGHADVDKTAYPLQTLKDNVRLFTVEVLDKINQVVVKHGQKVMGKKSDESLKGSADSFVVETNVHYPTDANLLFDALRGMIRLSIQLSDAAGLTGWRQGQYHLRNAKKHFRMVQRKKRFNKETAAEAIVNRNSAYIELAKELVGKTKKTIIEARGNDSVQVLALATELEKYIAHAERQIDQIDRRVLKNEKIPHHEKVFSIFEEHTEWISKGKAGVPVELGLRVCVVKDQFGFILHHHVMEKKTDDKVAVSIVADTKERFPEFNSCSFDKGFHSPENQKQIALIIPHVILPRKGRLSEEAKRIETSEEFRTAKRKHSAVESSINALEHNGLDRCPDHGLHGFKRYVGLAVLARNFQILGHHIRVMALKKKQRSKKSQRFRLAA